MSAHRSLGLELRQAARIAEERGYAAGLERGLAELDAAIRAAGVMAGRVEAFAPRETAGAAHAISELALAIARRVVAAELRADPAIVARALEAAVGSINGTPEARVLLHPSTLEPVREAWEQAHGRAHLGKRWIFEADATLPLGGCQLRYEHGFVDAGLERQLDEIGAALDAAIPGLWRKHLRGAGEREDAA